VTRSPDELADVADQGAHVRRGDFDEVASLPEAFAGADRALIVSAERAGDRAAGLAG
jgi:NAD(P)H dehydrogenase (quinone)